MNKKSSAVSDSLYSGVPSPDDGRPVSELKVDVHIYIVPPELWREHLQSAVNQVINDTVSAGFIRVMPDATVQSLRDEIETQVGFDLIPREFVFLKCVGRCLTRIKSKQERLLKVKNFIPPQAYAPEMFILELTPDIRAMPYSGSTSVQSSPLSGHYSIDGKNSGRRIPPIKSPIKSNTVAVQTGDDYFRDETLNSFDDWERYEEMESDAQSHWLPSESLNNQDPNSKSTQTALVGNGDWDAHKKPVKKHQGGGDWDDGLKKPVKNHQGGGDWDEGPKKPVKNHQGGGDWDDGIKKPVKNHQGGGDWDDGLKKPVKNHQGEGDWDDAPKKPVKNHQGGGDWDDGIKKPVKNHQGGGDWDDGLKKPVKNHPANHTGRTTEGYDPPLSATPTHSPEVPVHSTHAKSIQTLSEKELQELEELMRKEKEEEKRKAEAKRKVEEAERMAKERQKQEAIERKKQEEEQKRKKEEQRRLQEQEEAEKRKQNEEQKRLEEEKQRKLEEMRLEEEKRKEKEKLEKRKKEEAEKKKKEEEEKRKREEEEKRRKKAEEEERRREEEEERRREEEEEELRKELERKHKEEQRHKEEEQKRKEQQRKMEEEKQKKKMLEQQRAHEKANLMKEIEELKTDRLAKEEKRNELMKRAKQLQSSSSKAPAIKHNARDNWKKKYFEEKKKTAPLDEHCNRLKRHLESIHKRIVANMESSAPSSVNSQHNRPIKGTSTGGHNLRAKQLEHETEELQQRLESIKMKLTGEMKLRNQAEKDTRVLRAELSQRKAQRNIPDGYRLTARSQPFAASKS